ncbi:MAG: hypothetical protein WAX89_03620 [Alphaproteobacteria bacterium]
MNTKETTRAVRRHATRNQKARELSMLKAWKVKPNKRGRLRLKHKGESQRVDEAKHTAKLERIADRILAAAENDAPATVSKGLGYLKAKAIWEKLGRKHLSDSWQEYFLGRWETNDEEVPELDSGEKPDFSSSESWNEYWETQGNGYAALPDELHLRSGRATQPAVREDVEWCWFDEGGDADLDEPTLADEADGWYHVPSRLPCMDNYCEGDDCIDPNQYELTEGNMGITPADRQRVMDLGDGVPTLAMPIYVGRGFKATL